MSMRVTILVNLAFAALFCAAMAAVHFSQPVIFHASFLQGRYGVDFFTAIKSSLHEN